MKLDTVELRSTLEERAAEKEEFIRVLEAQLLRVKEERVLLGAQIKLLRVVDAMAADEEPVQAALTMKRPTSEPRAEMMITNSVELQKQPLTAQAGRVVQTLKSKAADLFHQLEQAEHRDTLLGNVPSPEPGLDPGNTTLEALGLED